MQFERSPDLLKIHFSWKEKVRILFNGHIKLRRESIRHFSNVLIRIAIESNDAITDDKIKNLNTTDNSVIKGE
jgi:hypothetical protein